MQYHFAEEQSLSPAQESALSAAGGFFTEELLEEELRRCRLPAACDPARAAIKALGCHQTK